MELVTTNLEGGEEKELLASGLTGFSPSSPEWSPENPAWSPNGKAIVTSRDEADRSSKLIAVDTASTKQQTIISSTEMRFADPVWLPDGSGFVCSPDGKWIYYVSPYGEKPKLQRVSIDGRTSKTVSEMLVFLLIDISRDGRLLAFFTEEFFGVVNTESGKVDRKFPVDPRFGSSSGVGSDTLFTPEGKALAHIIHVNSVDNIWVQPIDGAPAYPITFFKSDEIYDFSWSPSGGSLGIVRGRTDSNVVLIRETKS
jgi:WD40-like Beta Propeller Repeat